MENLKDENKELMIIPNAVHTDLYDNLKVIPFDKIEEFFIDEEIKNNEEIEETMQIYIKVNNRTLTAILENNSSAVALAERLKQNDITINMSDYGSFEKVGNLGFSLPRNDKQIATEAGDLILYQGNSITIYYDTNSWNFTKLGRIVDITQDELKEILGKGDVTVTFSLEK